MADLSGHLSLVAAPREHGRTVLASQSFRAPFHVSKPYWDPDAGVLLVQVVNPTAGILAGDRLESDITVESEAALLATTPSASRVFTMYSRGARCVQRYAVAAGGWLEVLPEPLVPHGGSRYHQVTTVDVAPGGALFLVDQLMPGRLARGEAWQWDRLCLELDVHVGGELVLRERIDHAGDELCELARLAGSGERACFANAVLIAEPGTAGGAWQPAVAALHRDGVWCGVSALRRGGWSLKIIAPDPLRLRETLRDARCALADYFPRLRCDPRKL